MYILYSILYKLKTVFSTKNKFKRSEFYKNLNHI